MSIRVMADEIVALRAEVERLKATEEEAKRLARELKSANEAFARLGAKRIMENGELAEQLEAAEAKLTSAPSDWQQRIAAIRPWFSSAGQWFCYFCGHPQGMAHMAIYTALLELFWRIMHVHVDRAEGDF
jgi:hypothetical protein